MIAPGWFGDAEAVWTRRFAGLVVQEPQSGLWVRAEDRQPPSFSPGLRQRDYRQRVEFAVRRPIEAYVAGTQKCLLPAKAHCHSPGMAALQCA